MSRSMQRGDDGVEVFAAGQERFVLQPFRDASFVRGPWATGNDPGGRTVQLAGNATYERGQRECGAPKEFGVDAER